MSAARIVVRHQGLILLDMPVRALVSYLNYQGDIAYRSVFQPDESTVVETHTSACSQSEQWLSPEDDEEGGA